MIFRHKEALFVASILIIATSNAQTNSRSYNTDDWVPVARPTSQNAENQEPAQKRPTGRVLNLPSSDEKRLYLPEQNPTPYRIPVNQQRPTEIRPDSNQQFVQSQRPFPQQPNKYQQPQAEFLPQPQQQILLPPQLESLISQGPSYLTPQRINSQLLPEPQSYQPTIQTLPTQAFPLNATEFNSRDVVQNINLGLYNQQQVRPTTHKHNHHNDNPEPEVQLLYVPLENLQRQRGQRQQIPYPTEQNHQIYQQPPPQQYHHATHKQVQHNLEQDYIPHQIQTQKPSAHKQVQLHNIEQDYVQQVLQAQKLQEQFQHLPVAQPPPQLLKSYRQPYFQEEATKVPTTPAPTQATKKRKPHQPPLAVYMGTEGHDEIKVGDVLSLLKEAKTISVQDSVGPDSPQVFVGPSHLEPPEGYVKFDLPYLSSIEGNRVERKVDQLPFFVAPLSYKTPPGYSKIPFPAPHVGSVVINHLKASPSPQTSTTEHIRFVPTQTTEDNRYYNQETSTHRTRTRQRQPTRGSHTASTTVKSIIDEIPYGPLPTKVVENQNLNPYGPTKFVQSSTPPTYDQSSLPEQIFSTRNRFSTPAPTTYSQNIPSRHNKYLPHSTESTPTSTTLSAALSNDKYTVLEEFNIKPNQQVSHQKHQTRFRPTQDTYTDESGEKTSLPLLSNPQILNDEIQNSFRPSFIYKNPQTQYEPTQEVPTKHRIVEHYNIQSEQPVTQTSPVYEFVKESHKQQQQYVPEYYQPQNIDKAPVRHSNVHYSPQDSSTQRTRGKQHFQSEYQDEYDQQSIVSKPTESVISVTKEPVIEYQTPEIQSHHLTGVREQAHVSENYYHVQQEPQKQDYVLPAELPPISPQLPGLINSLQDQQRPLLAPLLLPPSEQTPHISSEAPLEHEYYSVEPSTSTTTTTTTTTTTPVPITESTTQYKRTRSRQRGTRPTTSHDYSYTTPAPRRAPTNYRTRRPASQNTNTQQRQEFTSRTKERENYPSSTIHSDIDSTTRATFTRNRQVSRDRQPYVSSTTEQPKRSPAPTVPSSRQRFRTRGRPAKSEEDYLERSTPENEPVFYQPQLEGGFQAAVPVLQQHVELTLPNENIQRESATSKTQKEQALIYIQNKPTAPEASSIQQVTSEEIINRPNYVSSTEALEPLYHSTIAASAPENNIVHDQPTLPVNPSVSPQQYSPTQTAKIDHHSREHSHFKYRDDEEEIKDPSTTEFTRQRTRIRTKTRARTNPVTTSRYQQQQTSTNPSNHRSSSESSQEDQEEEFYGFFRPPNFQKPVQVEYKTNSDSISTPRSSPTVAYVRQPTETAQNVYVSPDNNPIYSTPRSYSPVTHDNYANPNIQTQYVSSTLSPPSISSEDNVDIQPVTRRPVSTNYRRRPNTPVRGDVSVSTEKYYSRTSKRPETNSPQGSRIRGRTRRPTSRPTTDADAYSHSPRTNELENHSEEYREPTKSRTRTINRGKSHFQGATHKQSSTEDLENENYPVAFLQGQSIQPTRNYGNTPAGSSQQSVVSSDTITPRSTFQLTIEPEEVYDDQVPNYSIKKPNVASSSKDLEDGGEESKFSAKVVEKPSNFNFIVSEEKGTEKSKEEQKENSEPTTTPSTLLTESSEKVENETTVANIEDVTTQSSDVSTTEIPTTTEEFTDKPKNRRRGVWKLKKIRPLNEEFESAESQNVGTVFDNQFDVNEKPLRRYKVVHRLRTTTEPLHPETTTVVLPETTSLIAETEKIVADVSTTEASVFEPLYEMFGFKSEHEEQQLASNDELTTTEASNLYNTFIDEVETTTFINNNTTTALPEETNDDSPSATPRIIGTSTTTEISHETEICYRGRCVKSTSTENIEKV